MACVLVIGVALGACIMCLPSSSADTSGFSAENAAGYLKVISQKPHSVFDEENHEEVRQCLHFAIYQNGYVDPMPYLINESPFNTDNFTSFVKSLQEIIKVNIDGIPGSETLSKTPTISTSTGWNHAAVRPLQVYLQSLGYDLGKCKVDGKFGKDMKACIKKYQADNNLPIIDGKISARMYTWKKLLKLK